MKTYPSILIFLLFIFSKGFAQNCSVNYYSDYGTMPEVTVNVVFHFLHDNRPGSTDFTSQQAHDLADIFIENTNDNLGNMQPCNKPGPNNITPPQVGDTKIRLNSYNVFLYTHTDENAISNPYGNNVLNIILNYGTSCQNYGDTQEGYIRLCNIGTDIFDGSPTSNAELVKRARVICHELGHVLSLGLHSYDSGCDCDGIDISSTNESTNGYGNNIMSYGGQGNNDPLNWNCAITPCQWGKVFNYIVNGDANGLPHYVSWPSCNQPNEVLITNGQVVVWSGTKIINQNIVVKTGGYLRIECLVKMGAGCVIYVERGAKLVIDGGKITKLCDEKWGGIYVWGNTNKDQPNPSPSISMQASDDAGILYMYNGAILEYAYNAVSNARRDDGSVGYWDLIQYRGGVIFADRCYFRNNQRSGEFISYLSPSDPFAMDKSIFKNDCQFSDGYWGVTIWNVNLTLDNCSFTNHNEAILAWDAGFKIFNASNFSNNYYGISLNSTSLWSTTTQIGEQGSSFNKFMSNNYNIRAYSQGGSGTLNIHHNNLENIFPDASGSSGIYIESPTKFSIFDNLITGQGGGYTEGVSLRNTGDFVNSIKCNYFTNLPIGLLFYRTNLKTQFLKNYFYSSSISDVYLYPSTWPITKINATQGNGSQAAGNMFTNPDNVLAIYHPSSVSTFEYKLPNGEPINSFKVPKCNLTTSGFNCNNITYTTHKYTNFWNFSPVEQNCSTPLGTSEDSGDEYQYFRLQTEVENLEKNIEQNGNIDKSLTDELSQKQDKKEKVLTYLLRKAIKDKDINLAKRVLQNEKDLHHKKKLVGVCLELKSWGEARRFLNTLPNNTESLQNFRYIQKINIDRLESRERYKLNAQQKGTLQSIAESDDLDNTGYAKSLLSLLEGMRFMDRALEGVSLRGASINGTTVSKSKKTIAISPNPAYQKVQFDIPSHFNINRIVFYDINGSVAKVITTQSERFETNIAELPGGIYILKFFDVDNTPRHLTKLFVSK